MRLHYIGEDKIKSTNYLSHTTPHHTTLQCTSLSLTTSHHIMLNTIEQQRWKFKHEQIKNFNYIYHHNMTLFHISYYIVSHTISYLILYRISSHHIISYQIISHHIISYHILSYHIISYQRISYHFMGWDILIREKS